MKYVTTVWPGRPIAPIWIGWIRIARLMFYRRWYGKRRDHANSWIFNHAPKGLRRAVMWLGTERNQPEWMRDADPVRRKT